MNIEDFTIILESTASKKRDVVGSFRELSNGDRDKLSLDTIIDYARVVYGSGSGDEVAGIIIEKYHSNEKGYSPAHCYFLVAYKIRRLRMAGMAFGEAIRLLGESVFTHHVSKEIGFNLVKPESSALALEVRRIEAVNNYQRDNPLVVDGLRWCRRNRKDPMNPLSTAYKVKAEHDRRKRIKRETALIEAAEAAERQSNAENIYIDRLICRETYQELREAMTPKGEASYIRVAQAWSNMDVGQNLEKLVASKDYRAVARQANSIGLTVDAMLEGMARLGGIA